jgi:hypothetical protein
LSSYAVGPMGFLVSNLPTSASQRRINWGLFSACCFTGMALGFLGARRAAASGSGYAAQYIYAYGFFRAIGIFVLAVPPLIYWRTRWLGYGIAAAAVLSVVCFGVGMRILRFENQVPWMRSRQTAATTTGQFSAVIYFRKEVTSQEVEEFRTSVLMEDAMPRHQGRDFPTFVTNYSRVVTNLSEGRQAVALTLADASLTRAEESYLKKIETDSRVQTIELPPFPFPSSLPSEPKLP